MNEQEARALALWIKDHDTRFIANVANTKNTWTVTLTDQDGGEQEPASSLADYKSRFVDVPTCAPTIREKWERFETSR